MHLELEVRLVWVQLCSLGHPGKACNDYHLQPGLTVPTIALPTLQRSAVINLRGDCDFDDAFPEIAAEPMGANGRFCGRLPRGESTRWKQIKTQINLRLINRGWRVKAGSSPLVVRSCSVCNMGRSGERNSQATDGIRTAGRKRYARDASMSPWPWILHVGAAIPRPLETRRWRGSIGRWTEEQRTLYISIW